MKNGLFVMKIKVFRGYMLTFIKKSKADITLSIRYIMQTSFDCQTLTLSSLFMLRYRPCPLLPALSFPYPSSIFTSPQTPSPPPKAMVNVPKTSTALSKNSMWHIVSGTQFHIVHRYNQLKQKTRKQKLRVLIIIRQYETGYSPFFVYFFDKKGCSALEQPPVDK